MNTNTQPAHPPLSIITEQTPWYTYIYHFCWRFLMKKKTILIIGPSTTVGDMGCRLVYTYIPQALRAKYSIVGYGNNTLLQTIRQSAISAYYIKTCTPQRILTIACQKLYSKKIEYAPKIFLCQKRIALDSHTGNFFMYYTTKTVIILPGTSKAFITLFFQSYSPWLAKNISLIFVDKKYWTLLDLIPTSIIETYNNIHIIDSIEEYPQALFAKKE